MTTAVAANTAQRQDDDAALGTGLVDRGANRCLHGDAEQTADRGHKSDFGLTPMLLGDQKDIEKRPDRAAHVGCQEIDRVERERVETLALD